MGNGASILADLDRIATWVAARPALLWSPAPGAVAVFAGATITDEGVTLLEQITRTELGRAGLVVASVQHITTGNRAADGRATRIIVLDVGGTDRTPREWPVNALEAAIRAHAIPYPFAIQAHPSTADLETWRLRRKGLMPDLTMTPERGSDE
jgi:hypothetical protein